MNERANSGDHWLWLGPALATVAYFVGTLSGLENAAAITAGITVLCVCWWISEAIPIPLTSLLPIALFPLLGVLDKNQVAQAYGSSLILLLLGGFMLSKAMEHSGAHRRLALIMLRLVGANSGRRIVAGFMIAAAVLSMWISNTATVLMLLPVAMAMLAQSDDKSLTIPLMLGIAYAASIGGVGTPIGTPPNLIYMEVYRERSGQELGFLSWMQVALPVVVLFLPLMMLWLTRNIGGPINVRIPEGGAWSTHEKRVLWVFALTALAWTTRQEPFGGWRTWFDLPNANDASVALLAVIMMFLIPSGKDDRSRLLTWERASDIHWGVLLLFAGGLCIAKAFQASGLGQILAENLAVLSGVPLFLLLLLLCLFVTFLTETTSNTASAALLLPILAAAAGGIGVDESLLMLPAVISASCAFMLPVATAPNAIVFASGEVTTKQMAREGVMLNLMGALLIASYFFAREQLF
jgi:sodium-dependent dicarboxylate transporter 2/3/5